MRIVWKMNAWCTRIVILACLLAGNLHGQSHDAFPQQKRSRYYDDGKKLLSVSGCFEIIDDDYIIVYRQSGFYKTSGHTFFYFSESLDSPIYPLKFKWLKQTFDDPNVRAALKANSRRLADVVDGRTTVNRLLSRRPGQQGGNN